MNRLRETGIAVVISAVVVIAIEGIIGNQANNAFIFLIGLIANSIKHNEWPWLILGLSCIVILLEAFYFWQHQKISDLALKRMTKMTELDSSLLKLLANWIPTSDRQNEITRILAEVVRDAAAEFNENPKENPTRAAVLLPDSSGDYLRCIASCQMPQETVDEMYFYIGEDEKKRDREGGVAGYVYHAEKLLVAHMTYLDNKHWVCKDCTRYVRFKEMNSSPPPYKSFVNVPIFGPDPIRKNKVKCIGILCFDSVSESIFDSEDIGVILLNLASRIASAILISEKLPIQ